MLLAGAGSQDSDGTEGGHSHFGLNGWSFSGACVPLMSLVCCEAQSQHEKKQTCLSAALYSISVWPLASAFMHSYITDPDLHTLLKPAVNFCLLLQCLACVSLLSCHLQVGRDKCKTVFVHNTTVCSCWVT